MLAADLELELSLAAAPEELRGVEDAGAQVLGDGLGLGPIEKLLEGFAVTFSITSPFEVQEHNATSRKGKTLTWEFNLETLKSGEVTGIYARLKR